MGKIISLPKNLSNQISAGEVVERPVSVIKELVENAIDAGSSHIRVEIKWAGLSEIIVSDDGIWIQEEDFPLLAEKYSTSKIKSLEDLYNVMSFWFRWEALASISSVSEFSLVSKTKEATIWNKLFFQDDKKIIQEFPSEKGTKISIKNLFHSTPARLNYLKSEKTEYAHILEFLQQISISYPEIGFVFIADEKVVFNYGDSEDTKTRIFNIYGENFMDNLLSIDFSFAWIRIEGFVSDPKVSFSNKNRQVFFVNKRIIKSPIIYKAISDAYNRFIPHGSFPGYILSLSLDPSFVDVNVHPRKMEIRFADEKTIFRAVYNSIFWKLEKLTLNVWDIKKEEGNIASSRDNFYVGSGTKFKNYSPYKDINTNPSQTRIQDSLSFTQSFLAWNSSKENSEENLFFSAENEQEKEFDIHETSLWKIVAQVFNSYIIVEWEKGLKFIDQHALAERIIYEKLVKNKKSSSSQKLLISLSLHLTPKEQGILEQNAKIFEEMGFEFEFLSSGIILLSHIPSFLERENIEKIFLWVIEDIWEYEAGKSTTLDEIQNKILAFTACRSAVKFGNKLSVFEINKLLADANIGYSSTCPHGRPVIFEITMEELKNKFER